MSDLLGPKGKQIPDHSLELADLPLAGGEKRVLISNAAKEFEARELTIADVSGVAPTSHTHGNIAAAGAVGSTPNLPLVTTTGGTVTAGAWHAATPAAPTTTGSAGASNSPARGDHAHPSRIATSAPASPVNGDIWMV